MPLGFPPSCCDGILGSLVSHRRNASGLDSVRFKELRVPSVHVDVARCKFLTNVLLDSTQCSRDS